MEITSVRWTQEDVAGIHEPTTEFRVKEKGVIHYPSPNLKLTNSIDVSNTVKRLLRNIGNPRLLFLEIILGPFEYNEDKVYHGESEFMLGEEDRKRAEKALEEIKFPYTSYYVENGKGEIVSMFFRNKEEDDYGTGSILEGY